MRLNVESKYVKPNYTTKHFTIFIFGLFSFSLHRNQLYDMAKKQKEPKKSQKSIYLDDTLWDKIDAKAAKESRSINNLVEIVLEKEFK